MTISLIVAVSKDGLIGVDNRLPWQLPRDLRRFRSLTMGKAIVMGRRTHESLGRPLDGRLNLVLSRRADFRAEGCEVVPSLADAIARAGDYAAGATDPEVMIIGGAEVFREALPGADRVYLTVVEGDFQGDTTFPLEALDRGGWRVVAEEAWPADEKNRHPHRFAILERVGDR